MVQEQNLRPPGRHISGPGFALGLAIGVAIGIGFDDLSGGIALGLGIGLALGLVFDRTHQDR